MKLFNLRISYGNKIDSESLKCLDFLGGSGGHDLVLCCKQ